MLLCQLQQLALTQVEVVVGVVTVEVLDKPLSAIWNLLQNFQIWPKLTKVENQAKRSSLSKQDIAFKTFHAFQIPVLLPHQVREHPICDALKSNKVKTIKRKENEKEMPLKALCSNSLGFHRDHTHSEAPFLGRIRQCTPGNNNMRPFLSKYNNSIFSQKTKNDKIWVCSPWQSRDLQQDPWFPWFYHEAEWEPEMDDKQREKVWTTGMLLTMKTFCFVAGGFAMGTTLWTSSSSSLLEISPFIYLWFFSSFSYDRPLGLLF